MVPERLPKIFVLALLAAVVLTGPSAGQDRESALELKLDLQQRYQLDFVHVEDAAGGTLVGLFTLAGELTPEADSLKGAGEPVDPREVARFFLDREAALFALEAGHGDLRLSRIFSDENGAAHLVYRRWLGELPLDGMEIRLHVDASGQLYAVDGYSVPLTFAEREAIASSLAESRLDKEDVTALVMQDLGAQGIPQEILKLREVERVAIPDSPYVIWKADVIAATGNGRWLYRIDASTGEILEAVDALESAGGSKSIPSQESWSAEPPYSPLPATVEADKESLPISGTSELLTKQAPPAAVTEGFKRETPDPVTGLMSSATKRLDYASSEEAKAKREAER